MPAQPGVEGDRAAVLSQNTSPDLEAVAAHFCRAAGRREGSLLAQPTIGLIVRCRLSPGPNRTGKRLGLNALCKTTVCGPLRVRAWPSTIEVFSLGLVPAKAFRASLSEAAPYRSDKRKIDYGKIKFSFANSGSFQSWGSFQSVSNRNAKLRRGREAGEAELCRITRP